MMKHLPIKLLGGNDGLVIKVTGEGEQGDFILSEFFVHVMLVALN